MKQLILNGVAQEDMKAERIEVDKTKKTIIGFNGKDKIFSLTGIDFTTLNYSVDGGEDTPTPSADEKAEKLKKQNADIMLMLARNGIK